MSGVISMLAGGLPAGLAAAGIGQLGLLADISEHVNWIAGALIVFVGLFVLGLTDLMRFSWRRVWAISGVAFDESVRRRVLWITPLAILGVIVVVQLQRPLDEQDAIRQTSKFCLFATGLVVSVTTIILACTNLPKEIENRVIYTIVTKPTTRLEIVLGKIVGFARVSALILVIMGVFTYAYLQVRGWNLRRSVADRLDAGLIELVSRPTMEHYRQAGLLSAKTMQSPLAAQVVARMPQVGDSKRWMLGEGEQDLVVPFQLPEDLVAADGANAGMFVELKLGWERVKPGETGKADEDEAAATPAASQPTTAALGPTPFLVPNAPPAAPTTPSAVVQFLGTDQAPIGLPPNSINDGKPIPLSSDGSAEVHRAFVLPPAVATLANNRHVYVDILGSDKNVEYWAAGQVVRLVIPASAGQPERVIEPAIAGVSGLFRGRRGAYGETLRGEPDDKGPVAIYNFRGATINATDGRVPFELHAGIERQGKESVKDADDVTVVTVRVQNLRSGKTSDPIVVKPESNRTAFFDVPVDAVAGGDFDLLVQCETHGHWLGVTNASMNLVASQESFGFNLLKSLFILWLMSVLVTVVAIFSSTFLSWPIAVVLTLVILLGRWGVEELGDAATPGIGNQVATDMGLQDPAKAKVVSTSVEALTKYLRTVASVLPDISQFSATEDIERGMTIPPARITEALWVIGGFGLPMTVLAYIFLKNKEVAP